MHKNKSIDNYRVTPSENDVDEAVNVRLENEKRIEKFCRDKGITERVHKVNFLSGFKKQISEEIKSSSHEYIHNALGSLISNPVRSKDKNISIRKNGVYRYQTTKKLSRKGLLINALDILEMYPDKSEAKEKAIHILQLAKAYESMGKYVSVEVNSDIKIKVSPQIKTNTEILIDSNKFTTTSMRGVEKFIENIEGIDEAIEKLESKIDKRVERFNDEWEKFRHNHKNAIVVNEL